MCVCVCQSPARFSVNIEGGCWWPSLQFFLLQFPREKYDKSKHILFFSDNKSDNSEHVQPCSGTSWYIKCRFPTIFPAVQDFPRISSEFSQGTETPPRVPRPRAAPRRPAAAEQRPRGRPRPRPRGGAEALLAATHARRGHTHSDTWDDTFSFFFRFVGRCSH